MTTKPDQTRVSTHDIPTPKVSITTTNRQTMTTKPYKCLFRGKGRHGRDCMLVEFKTTHVISAYHH